MKLELAASRSVRQLVANDHIDLTVEPARSTASSVRTAQASRRS
jgi:hypothetical protein